MMVEKIGGKYRYKVSTESSDCEKERILISAWTKLGKFPLHVNHDKSKLVGSANVFIREGELLADVEVTDEPTKARVESGELSMASVGFDRLEFAETKDGQIITTKADLREISLVPQGCNFDANRIKCAKGPVPAPASEVEEVPEASEAPIVDPAAAPGDYGVLAAVVSAAVQSVMGYRDKYDELMVEHDKLKLEHAEALARIAALEIAGEPDEPEPDEPEPAGQLDAEDKEAISKAVRAAFNSTARKAVAYHTGELD